MNGLISVVLYAIGIIMFGVGLIAVGMIIPELWFLYIAVGCLYLGKKHWEDALKNRK
jgi:uncharacterized membrane protein YbaN (DUF454 family)